ncbi:Crp/Fnr family transcriptional regulator [Devosia sp.]|uniref:Crp/Fnr family transcriptional regulator n=1 Tax=Devosia sp. TaxID=1871048 RepID=UPI0035AF77E1
MKTVRFKAGETILTEGEDGDSAYLLVSGAVKVTVGTNRVAVLNAGEVFGEMSLLDPGPRSATVTATTDVECTVTTYDEFIVSLQDRPEQAIIFMRTLVRRLRQTNELLNRLDPRKRGLRGLLSDLQQSMSLEALDLKDEEAVRPYYAW